MRVSLNIKKLYIIFQTSLLKVINFKYDEKENS